MLNSGLTLALSLLIVVSPSIQQDNTVAGSAKTDVTTFSRADNSTPSDQAVPLCPAKFDDSLETDGIASQGDKSVTPPKPTKMVNAKFSDESRHEGWENHIHYFEVWLGFVVGAKGIPQDVCLMKSAGYGLDAEAAKAVEQSRFKPATKGGKPIAVRLTTNVSFRLR
jgi:TonB family protein